MLETELGRISRMIVEDISNVDEDSVVLVVTDAKNFDAGKAIHTAARSIGASSTLTMMPPMAAHSNEPAPPVAASLLEADVFFMTTYQSFSHTTAARKAQDAGTEMVVMRGVTTEMMLEGSVNTDYEELGKVTRTVRDVLHEGRSVGVKTDLGTDVEFDISERPAFTLSGPKTETGLGGVGLPPGEAPIAPVEGSSGGVIVIDYSMDNIGKLSAPIRLFVEDGYVTEIEGGSDAETLRALLADKGKSARNIAEFAIGTNRDSRLIGNLAEDKKKRGTIHFAIGDNVSLGGSVQSDLHLDGVVLNPTVIVDGKTVVEKGQLKI